MLTHACYHGMECTPCGAQSPALLFGHCGRRGVGGGAPDCAANALRLMAYLSTSVDSVACNLKHTARSTNSVPVLTDPVNQ